MRFAAALAAFLILAVPASAEAPSLTITRVAPAVGTTVATRVALYLEVRYVSDVPIRLQAEAFAGGARVTEQMMNASIVHPAGDGVALVWIARSEPGSIDAVHVTAYDAGWTPLTTLIMPAPMTWSDSISAVPNPPDWAEALIAEEARAIDAQSAAAVDDEGNLLIGGIVTLGTPLYLLLQILALIRLTGFWRIAALVPAVPMGLAILHGLWALAMGSNLWPILVILGAPLALLYLVALFGVRFLTQRMAAA